MRRLALIPLAAALVAAGAGSAVAGPVRATAPHVAVTQPLVILLQDHVARASASTQARVIEPVAAVRPLTQVRARAREPRARS